MEFVATHTPDDCRGTHILEREERERGREREREGESETERGREGERERDYIGILLLENINFIRKCMHTKTNTERREGEFGKDVG